MTDQWTGDSWPSLSQVVMDEWDAGEWDRGRLRLPRSAANMLRVQVFTAAMLDAMHAVPKMSLEDWGEGKQ